MHNYKFLATELYIITEWRMCLSFLDQIILAVLTSSFRKQSVWHAINNTINGFLSSCGCHRSRQCTCLWVIVIVIVIDPRSVLVKYCHADYEILLHSGR
jgi:hypothetical protein